METNKQFQKYTLGNYKFLQYFAESQDEGGNGEGGNGENNEHSNQDVPPKAGGTDGNDEHSGGDDSSKDNGNPNEGEKGDGDAEVFDKPYVESLRKENAKYRTRAKESQEQFEAFANDLKSFLEKNGVEVESAESKSLLAGLDGVINSSRQTVLNAELERVTAQHNIVDSEIMLKLIDVDSLKFENGHYVGLEEQVKAITEAKPYLVKQQAAADTKPPKGGQGTGGAPTKLTQNDLNNMTSDEIAKALKNGELNHLL